MRNFRLRAQEENTGIQKLNEVTKYLMANRNPSPDAFDEKAKANDIIDQKPPSEHQTEASKEVHESETTDSAWDGHQNDPTISETVRGTVTAPTDDTIPVSSDALPSSSPDVSSGCLYCLSLLCSPAAPFAF